mmetsp:Transcript_6111/g.23090  ORF Transcript_6111/g.23090 Transcript_6111/m.23090 type:complete len:204 (+) Transcript_6111:1892-2503(+)
MVHTWPIFGTTKAAGRRVSLVYGIKRSSLGRHRTPYIWKYADAHFRDLLMISSADASHTDAGCENFESPYVASSHPRHRVAASFIPEPHNADGPSLCHCAPAPVPCVSEAVVPMRHAGSVLPPCGHCVLSIATRHRAGRPLTESRLSCAMSIAYCRGFLVRTAPRRHPVSETQAPARVCCRRRFQSTKSPRNCQTRPVPRCRS